MAKENLIINLKEEWKKTEEKGYANRNGQGESIASNIFRIVTSSILARGGALALLKLVIDNLNHHIDKLIEEEKTSVIFINLVSLYVIITSTISILINIKIIPHSSVYDDILLSILRLYLINLYDEDMIKLKKEDIDGTENKYGTKEVKDRKKDNKEDFNKYDRIKFFGDKLVETNIK
ncbi:28095_t:CDS:2 [Dentiscutata erythropus]|uniref:28095_t:CDS:1 n=1 Tax=Dentiscutata erythropus TaxID=1348616 RepID=A0A9N9EMI9_9GLOM|nr:28095_t:CDS:2 [Dentiscutata erythropus]